VFVFVDEGKPENPEESPWSKAQLKPHMAPGRNRTWATLVGGERSHHCTIPARHSRKYQEPGRFIRMVVMPDGSWLIRTTHKTSE